MLRREGVQVLESDENYEIGKKGVIQVRKGALEAISDILDY